MDESGMISSDIVILLPTTMPLLQKKHDNTSLPHFTNCNFHFVRNGGGGYIYVKFYIDFHDFVDTSLNQIQLHWAGGTTSSKNKASIYSSPFNNF